MAQVLIREATSLDIPASLRHRRLMWWDMGRRDETALYLMERAATEYFSQALPQGSYRGFLAVDASANVIGGGGSSSVPGPASLGSFTQRGL
jgi:hypothetical protein